jgi:hypothetical protein
MKPIIFCIIKIKLEPLTTRHYIETVFSEITSDLPKSIHACTLPGFLLELQAFILAFTLQKAFI